MEPRYEPRIETERCVLRAPELGDAPNLSTYAGDYDVASMTSSIPSPYPVLAAEMWVLGVRAGWGKRPNFSFIIEHEGQCAGGAGVFRRTPKADWELGYWIGKPWQGKGLATEVGRALMGFAREDVAAGKVIAAHAADNPASGRVLEKLGFRYTGERDAHWAMARLGQSLCLNMEWNPAG